MNYFQTHAAGFVRSPYFVGKGEKVSKRFIIITFNYNIVRDRFETHSVNVMKNRPLVAKKQRKLQYILAWLSLSENHENCH